MAPRSFGSVGLHPLTLPPAVLLLESLPPAFPQQRGPSKLPLGILCFPTSTRPRQQLAGSLTLLATRPEGGLSHGQPPSPHRRCRCSQSRPGRWLLHPGR